MEREEIKVLADQIVANITSTTKSVLTSDEAALYLGVSRGYLYQLTMKRKIPFYKSPNGRMCYFNRHEIEQWMQSSRVSTLEEIDQKAQEYCIRNKA